MDLFGSIYQALVEVLLDIDDYRLSPDRKEMLLAFIT